MHVTGCSARSRTPRTPCRRRCGRLEAFAGYTAEGAFAAHLAVQDRHQPARKCVRSGRSAGPPGGVGTRPTVKPPQRLGSARLVWLERSSPTPRGRGGRDVRGRAPRRPGAPLGPGGARTGRVHFVAFVTAQVCPPRALSAVLIRARPPSTPAEVAYVRRRPSNRSTAPSSRARSARARAARLATAANRRPPPDRPRRRDVTRFVRHARQLADLDALVARARTDDAFVLMPLMPFEYAAGTPSSVGGQPVWLGPLPRAEGPDG